MKLFDQIYEAVTKTKLKEETTSGDIAYLPGGFTTMKNALLPLIRKKKKWNIQIATDPMKEHYDFSLEGTSIKVPHKHWPSFQQDLRGLGDVSIEDGKHFFNFNASFVNEAISEQEEVAINRAGELQDALLELLHQAPFKQSIDISKSWYKAFGGLATKMKTALLSTNFQMELDEVVDLIKQSFGNDIGAYELATQALQDKQGLKFSPFFEGQEYLFGQQIVSSRNGVALKFSSTVDPNFVPSQKIEVIDPPEGLMEELDGIEGTKVVGHEIYPTSGKMFSFAYLNRLKKEIDLYEGETNV